MRLNPAILYGLGAIALGAVGFAVGDFALQWQPVPKGVPFREPLAYLSAAALVAGGLACLWPRTATAGALALGLVFAVWVVALHVPKALAGGPGVGTWNPVAEAWALALGGLAGWAATRRPELAAPAVRLFGVGPVIFGLAHFAYADFTASMVPAWIPPGQLVWAYLTGACQLAGGLALIAGIVPRLAATLLAAMYAGFVVLLHAPRVAADPSVRIEWTMLGIALTMTGAAWLAREATRKAP